MLRKIVFGKFKNKIDKKNSKRIIFIGGAKGIGKMALAKKIQNSLQNAIIVNKTDATEVLRETLMHAYRKDADDTSSAEYLYRVQPLEYEQLIGTMKHIVEYNNCDIIVVGQFFLQFSNWKWVDSMKSFGELNGYKTEFIFLKKNGFKRDEDRNLRRNLAFRQKIDRCIKVIEGNLDIEKYSTLETL